LSIMELIGRKTKTKQTNNHKKEILLGKFNNKV